MKFKYILLFVVFSNLVFSQDFSININKSNFSEIASQLWQTNKYDLKGVMQEALSKEYFGNVYEYNNDPTVNFYGKGSGYVLRTGKVYPTSYNAKTNEVFFHIQLKAFKVEVFSLYGIPGTSTADANVDITGYLYLKSNYQELGIRNIDVMAVATNVDVPLLIDIILTLYDPVKMAILFTTGAYDYLLDKITAKILTKHIYHKSISNQLPANEEFGNVYISSFNYINNEFSIGLTAYQPLGVTVTGPETVTIPGYKGSPNYYTYTVSTINALNPQYRWYVKGSPRGETGTQITFPINWSSYNYTFDVKCTVSDMGNRQASGIKTVQATGASGPPGRPVEPNISNREPLPTKFALGNVYPNPFNPQTTIPFDLPRFSFVNIEVYNSLGKKLAVLANQTYMAGRHSVIFDGSGFSSGLYIVSVKIKDKERNKLYTFTDKIILLK